MLSFYLSVMIVGPLGRNIEGDVSVRSPAAIYTYSKTKGLFAGISVEGSALIERKETNRKYGLLILNVKLRLTVLFSNYKFCKLVVIMAISMGFQLYRYTCRVAE